MLPLFLLIFFGWTREVDESVTSRCFSCCSPKTGHRAALTGFFSCRCGCVATRSESSFDWVKRPGSYGQYISIVARPSWWLQFHCHDCCLVITGSPTHPLDSSKYYTYNFLFFFPLFPTLSPIEWRPTWEEKVCRQYVKLSKLCVPPIVQPFVPSPSILVRPALLFNFPRQPLDSVDSLFRPKWIICRWTMNCWKKWLGPSPANETFLIAGSTDGAQPKVFLLPPPPIFLINL